MSPSVLSARDSRTPTPGAPEKTAVRSMFDRIAPRYDLANRVLSVGVDVYWRRRAVRALGLEPGMRVLDLCTGTADVLGEVLVATPRSFGAGIDLSSEMLVRGRRKLDQQGLGDRSGLLAGDAEALPIRSGAFAAAIVAFGIRNVAGLENAVREVHRVLGPGGRFVVLEFSTPGGAVGALYRFYSRKLLPHIGGWISGDRSAYAYLPASIARFSEPTALRSLLERCGFVETRAAALTWGIAHVLTAEKPR